MCATAALAAHPARATVVYNNGGPNTLTAGDIELNQNTLYDDFSVSTAQSLNQVDFYIAQALPGASTYKGTVQYGIFDNTGGNTPGALDTSGSIANATIADQHTTDNVGAEIYLVSFNLTVPFALSANHTYWLGLTGATTTNSNDDVFWLQTSSSKGTLGAQHSGGSSLASNPSTTLFGGNLQLAFEFESVPIVAPEPASLGLLGFGLAAAGFAARRKRP